MTTPYQHQRQPLGYVSPIPVRRATLSDAVASEWTKLRSLRSTMWTLGALIFLIVTVGVLAAVISNATSSTDEDALSLGFSGVLLGTICVMTLGVLTMTAEYGTGMIRTTLTACPSRARVLAAKSLVFFLLVFAITTLTTGIVGALQTTIMDVPSAGGERWFRATAGVGLYLALLGLLSLAVGVLIRHSAGAITIMIGVVLLPLVMALFMVSDGLSGLRDALFEYSVPSQLAVFYDNSVGPTGEGPTGWDPLWIMLMVTLAAMVGAFFALDRRDV